MIDVHAIRRRAVETIAVHRPALLSLSLAAAGFLVAGVLLLTPGLSESTRSTNIVRDLARGFGIAFGPAAVILALLAGATGLLQFLGARMRFSTARIVATVASVIAVPACFALMAGRNGGGIVGLLVADATLRVMPLWLALPLFLALAVYLVGTATEWLFYGTTLAPAKGKKKRQRKPAAKKKAKKAPKPDPLPEPEPEEDEYGEEYEEEEEAEEDEEYEYEDEEAEYEDEEEYEEEEEPEPEPEEEKPHEVPELKAVPAKTKALAYSPPPRRGRGKDKTPLPGLDLLERPVPLDTGRLERTIQKNAMVLERALASFRIETRVVGYTRGPVITMYELALKEGTKLSQVVNRADDLAIALKAESVRIVAPIPGKNTVGVEVPNIIRDDVRLHGLLEAGGKQIKKMAVPIMLGADGAGDPLIQDLATMPHLLIAGATGSGKSVCINAIITSILLTRKMDEVRLILVDPKQVELAFFKDIPHLLSEIVTDARKAAQTLDWIVTEMEDRYRIFALFGVRNIDGYNRLGADRIKELAEKHDVAEENAPDFMPYLVVIVDELADLIMTGRKEVEHAITRLAQKSRAVGIHTVLATQRPSTDVITGLIKANMPSRAAFKVTSKVDARVVLDRMGAEKLLGRGDMLLLPPRSFHLVRAQGCYVSDDEVRSVVDFLREQGPPQQLRELVVKAETIDDRDPREVDAMFDTAVRVVLESQRGSASLLQRALSIGYTRASRLIDLMRSQGIIGEFKNAQAADVLMTLEDYEAKYSDSTEL